MPPCVTSSTFLPELSLSRGNTLEAMSKYDSVPGYPAQYFLFADWYSASDLSTPSKRPKSCSISLSSVLYAMPAACEMISAVCLVRRSGEEMISSISSSLRDAASCLACSSPLGSSGTSVRPRTLFRAFHPVCPCLAAYIICAASAPSLLPSASPLTSSGKPVSLL